MLNELTQALEAVDRPRVEALFDEALRQHPSLQVVEKLMVPALERLGEEWSEGRLSLSQIYLASRLCEELVERELPPMAVERRGRPRQAIAVLSDYHMLGKRIVLAVMRASGYSILDYGHMDVAELVERVIADEVKILLISVLMLPAALKVKALRSALDERGVELRIAVGGAPFLFDRELWREVGADAMGEHAADAVTIVQRWMEEMA
jgi:methanogenic corrinoid protein MtbC1